MIQGCAYVSLLVDFERFSQGFSLIPVICELKVHHFRHIGLSDPSANFVAYNADLAAKDDALQMPKSAMARFADVLRPS